MCWEDTSVEDAQGGGSERKKLNYSIYVSKLLGL
jgi:hypothetical protein